MTDFNFQLNTKLPSGALINVRALTSQEFFEHLTQLNEIVQEVVDLDAALIAASNVARGGLTVQQPIVASPAAAPAGGGGGGLGTASDRWGNSYVDGAPGAPLTPRGPAIKRSATSKAGKPYAQWADPCEHPNYSGDRNPADKFERQFAN